MHNHLCTWKTLSATLAEQPGIQNTVKMSHMQDAHHLDCMCNSEQVFFFLLYVAAVRMYTVHVHETLAMCAKTEWITHEQGDELPRAHLDREVMKGHFPSPSIIFTIHLLLFVLLFLNRISVKRITIVRIRGGRHNGEGWMQRVCLRLATCVRMIV